MKPHYPLSRISVSARAGLNVVAKKKILVSAGNGTPVAKLAAHHYTV
jgi:hypothetical protein